MARRVHFLRLVDLLLVLRRLVVVLLVPHLHVVALLDLHLLVVDLRLLVAVLRLLAAVLHLHHPVVALVVLLGLRCPVAGLLGLHHLWVVRRILRRPVAGSGCRRRSLRHIS